MASDSQPDSGEVRKSVSKRGAALGPAWMDRGAGFEKLPVLGSSDILIENKWTSKFPSKPGSADPFFGPCSFKICGDIWTLDNFIGAGGYGQTYLATYENTGQRYVVKFLTQEKDPEVTFLQTVPYKVFLDRSIVSVIGVAVGIHNTMQGGDSTWSPAKHIIFMEAIPNGELFDFITAKARGVCKEALTEGTLVRFVRDIIHGMGCMISNGITHRDLKPDNMLIDENGRVIIIDLGHAKSFVDLATIADAEDNENNETDDPAEASTEDAQAKEVEQETSTSTVNDDAFLKMHTVGVGTPGYTSPEAARAAASKKPYDAELADVFTVGIVTFLMKLPSPPFYRGFSSLTNRGASPDMWKQWAKWTRDTQGSEFSDELKDFINCLWRRDPTLRPRFRDLEGVMAKDAEMVEKWPELRWLLRDKSDPLQFVQELTACKPNLSIRCPRVIEAFVEYVRSFDNVDDAFSATDENKNGVVEAKELSNKLGSNVSTKDVAAFMSKHTDGASMTLEQFKKMSEAWSFGGRKIVHNCGRNDARSFAWKPRPDHAASEEEMQAFTTCVKDAMKQKYKVMDASDDAHRHAAEDDGRKHDIFTVTMDREYSCAIRMNIYMIEGKLILESKIRWGSAIEEMFMLRELNEALVKSWGPRTEDVPQECLVDEAQLPGVPE